jgi:hypothetical protein
MENKHILKRIIQTIAVLGFFVLAGMESFRFAKNFLPGVYLAVVRVVAFPFLLIGIKMKPAENDGLIAILINAIMFMAPYVIAYIIITWGKKFSGLSRKSLFFIKVFAIFYIIQIIVVAVLYVTGLCFIFPQEGLFWILTIIEPRDYKYSGSPQFMLLALAYNDLIIMTTYSIVKYVFKSTKEAK